jgi:hypothetical protein
MLVTFISEIRVSKSGLHQYQDVLVSKKLGGFSKQGKLFWCMPIEAYEPLPDTIVKGSELPEQFHSYVKWDK